MFFNCLINSYLKMQSKKILPPSNLLLKSVKKVCQKWGKTSGVVVWSVKTT